MRYKNPYSIDFLLNDDAACRYVQENFICHKIKKFFEYREILDFEELPSRFSITDLDFKNVDFKYFYENLLKDINKQSDTINFTRYTVTYDRKLATKKCAFTDTFYNEFCLGDIPILYFIYFDLQEVYDEIRNFVENRGRK